MDRGICIVRLPQYSPDLSPIELVWNTFKSGVMWRTSVCKDDETVVRRSHEELQRVTHKHVFSYTRKVYEGAGLRLHDDCSVTKID